MTKGSDEQARYRARRRELAREYLGGACVVCGSVDDLHFDHIDPSTKTIAISQAIIAGWSWERLTVELDKCQLLCSPHHLEKSRLEGSLGGEPWNKLPLEHGTHGMYVREKCRCPDCSEWKRRSRLRSDNG